jgi:hypothetical protein
VRVNCGMTFEIDQVVCLESEACVPRLQSSRTPGPELECVVDELKLGCIPGISTTGDLDYIRDMLADDARNRVLRKYGVSTVSSLVCGFAWQEVLWCVSAHGARRQELRLWRLGGKGDNECCHAFEHDASVEEMYVSTVDDIVIAVRSASCMVYYRFDGKRELLMRLEKGFRVMNVSRRIYDFSWCQFGDGRGVVLDDCGVLSEIRCPVESKGSKHVTGNASYESYEKILDCRSSQESPHDSFPQVSSLGTKRCESSPLHPGLALVAWQNAVHRFDFREKKKPWEIDSLARQKRSSMLCETSSPDGLTFITALAVPLRQVSQRLHAFAVSTPTHIHMYDMRKPNTPVVTWEHFMKYTLSRESGVDDTWELQTSLPDGLNFITTSTRESQVTRDGILFTNSYHGKGMLCLWNVEEAAPTIACFGGKLHQLPSSEMDPSDGSILDNTSAPDSSLSFSWKPIALERLEPVVPPSLVYSKIYPDSCMPDLIKWQDARILEAENRLEADLMSPRTIRMLPPKKKPMVRRDFGCAIVHRASRPEGPTLIRYGTFGEIISGSISGGSSMGHGKDSSPFNIELLEDPKAGSLPSREKEGYHHERKEQGRSSGSWAPETRHVPLAVHEWVFDKVRGEALSKEIDWIPENWDRVVIDGVPATEIRHLLLELLKLLKGTPISAFEAWTVFQRCIIEHESCGYLGEAPTLLSALHKRVEEFFGAESTHQNQHKMKRNRAIRSSRVDPIDQPPDDILMSYLKAKRLLPMLPESNRTVYPFRKWVQCSLCCKMRNIPQTIPNEHVERINQDAWTCNDNLWDSKHNSCDVDQEIGDDQVKQQLEQIERSFLQEQERLKNIASETQTSLTPSRAFLELWKSLETSNDIVSWCLRDPVELQSAVDFFTSLGLDDEAANRVSQVREAPLTPLEESLISMKKMKTTESPMVFKKRAPTPTTSVTRKLEALQKRWV